MSRIKVLKKMSGNEKEYYLSDSNVQVILHCIGCIDN